MEVIPVLDLKGGVVVHARMGQRDQYRPIRTPLSATSNPADIVRGLLSIHPFKTFYIADLDAIESQGGNQRSLPRDNDTALARLRSEFPGLSFWVDNGIADPIRAQAWLDRDLGDLVLGSETQKDDALLRRLRGNARVILSLDFRGEAFMGPPALQHDTETWPGRIIVMTLARVGSGAGPDMDRLLAIKDKAPDKRVYAAGGIRAATDLAMLARAGIAGALVSSSLHDGSLTGAQIARL